MGKVNLKIKSFFCHLMLIKLSTIICRNRMDMLFVWYQ
ncbi:hypothetical protein BTN49_0812 [Candidatus Enterovibrio escicola]|uniref:Uncharacterized protein n=1 Tax=Candidatus Enterovibrio escicola TaxID=1927127 RepID=A0A2A5T6Q7_9GAMM|nr:hypothetical protein BTN49_0812 [Candidatus Enterovibrio escacola]